MARAGLFRDRVTFQRLDSGTVDAYGNVYTGWANLATRSADLRERTGKEAIEGGALADVSLATMRCRADSVTSAVTAADRVVARGITWAIKNCTQVDAKDTLVEFILEKGVAS
jgi:head-tail adaptor|tara:strand:- start:4373 stop:4711 length:339 start_codon:yes stop_codon:yes gene_type:complete